MLLAQRTPAFDLSTTEPHMCIHEVRMPPLCVRNQDVGPLWTVDSAAGQLKKNDPAVYLRAHLCELAQHLPVHPVNNQPWLYTRRRTWAGTAPTSVASHRPLALDVYLHAYSGELAQCLPASHPVDNLPRLCTCTDARRACSPPVDHDAASCRKPALDGYFHTCLGELAEGLLALPPGGVERAGAAPTGVASYRKLPRLCTCTHTRESLLTVYRCRLLSTTGPGRFPAKVPGRAGAALTGVAFCRQAGMDVYLHTCSGKLV